ncbi:MAG: hypothetical protein PHQ90_11055 [Sulfuricurvum sp.]|uniref:hypothetical protein n=1 Tax=Sulfuricurvum sp. TaxID=2025608 RepID=UPI002620178C|nr:hypothetical protein [Sulfuricurvum sp.]MDD2369832.1 hypothetical protein [Sulfuricurvum sp.]MDD2949871.1 hypothetical protein [Sulfuricurvum sp.]MDD5118694.1 hypothetical protein [Sulfuricurvum sp.]
MVGLTLESIIGYIGLICLWIVVIWQLIERRKRLKEGTFQYIPKDPWWKKTYIWQVFFRRAFYRPVASTFPYLIFVIPATLMVFGYSTVLFSIAINGNAKKLEKMQTVSGIVTKVHRGKGKNSYDYIWIKDDKGNEEEYRLCCFYYDEEAEEFKQKLQDSKTKVTIWYQDIWWLGNYKNLRELKVDNKFITLNNRIKFNYDYEKFIEREQRAFPNLLWWLNYSMFGWMWVWWLNKIELPIHRLNRIKHYKKNHLKDK